MTVSLKKWGNSLALRIPKDIAKTLNVTNNSLLELNVENGTLVVKPQNKTRLEELVSGIDTGNLHEEITTDGATGNEVW